MSAHGLVAVALGLALIGCAGQAPVAIPGAESVVMDAPTYSVGDEWRFTGPGYESRIRIVEVTDDTVVNVREVPARIGGCSGCRVVRDRNLTVVKVIEENGQPRASVGLRESSFSTSRCAWERNGPTPSTWCQSEDRRTAM
jgi:hypothetical protein